MCDIIIKKVRKCIHYTNISNLESILKRGKLLVGKDNILFLC